MPPSKTSEQPDASAYKPTDYITISRDSYGLPIVRYQTKRTISYVESAKPEEHHSLRMIGLILFAMFAVYQIGKYNYEHDPHTRVLTEYEKNGNTGMAIMFIAACVFGLLFHVVKLGNHKRRYRDNPEFKNIDNHMQIMVRSKNMEFVLGYFRENVQFYNFPYSTALSFSLSTDAEWLHNPTASALYAEAKIPSTFLIMAKDADGVMQTIAIHDGDKRSLSAIHNALTEYFLTNYNDNIALIEKAVTEAEAGASPAGTSGGRDHKSKPTTKRDFDADKPTSFD